MWSCSGWTKPDARGGLLGFAIERDDQTEQETHFLENFLLFEVNCESGLSR
jgi:hypothetical protein